MNKVPMYVLCPAGRHVLHRQEESQLHQETPEGRIPAPGDPQGRPATGPGGAGQLLWPWGGAPGQHLGRDQP